MNMTHPDILEAERFGGEYNFGSVEPEMVFVGCCSECGADIYDNQSHFTDKFGHMFCDEYCVKNFYEFEEIDD